MVDKDILGQDNDVVEDTSDDDFLQGKVLKGIVLGCFKIVSRFSRKL